MAWGYEKCFTIEHDNTLKRRIDCKDCIYYDSSDKSCMKRPLYLPVDGYNSWRNCKYFELDHSVSHYDEKSLQYVHELARRKRQQEQWQKTIHQFVLDSHIYASSSTHMQSSQTYNLTDTYQVSGEKLMPELYRPP